MTDYRQICVNCLVGKDLSEEMSREIENGIYEYTTRKAIEYQICMDFTASHFRQVYSNKLHAILTNMEDAAFMERIRSGEIDARSIATMKPHEMCPERWQDIIQRNNKVEELIARGAERTTDSYTCIRCRHNIHSYFDIQSRSMDEPMTRHFTCCNCGNRWKMN